MSSTWWAASISALTPAAGSSPACEARPATDTSKVPHPLRPVFTAPPSAAPSATSTAPQARARSSMSAREKWEPTSSSEVTRISTPDRSSSAASPWIACTRPPSMSKTPGPVARPSSTRKGRRARVPSGNTVSWCPRTSTRGVPPPDQWTCGPPPLSTSVARPPSRASMTPATVSADFRRASRSREGDSTSTRVRRSSSIASTLTAMVLCVVTEEGYAGSAGEEVTGRRA